MPVGTRFRVIVNIVGEPMMKTALAPAITLREKFCYGLGDTSANIFMGMTMMFLSIYYTDVFRLSPVAMGSLFLLARFIDAIGDP